MFEDAQKGCELFFKVFNFAGLKNKTVSCLNLVIYLYTYLFLIWLLICADNNCATFVGSNLDSWTIP